MSTAWKDKVLGHTAQDDLPGRALDRDFGFAC